MITLTTDFGHSDAFVGIMKGVILSIARQAQIVDLCHETPPQDIVAGALLLADAVPFFPASSIHLAVVDPGVGSNSRAAVAVQTENCMFVGPDNGLPELALRRERAIRIVRLNNPEFQLSPVSATFHGRDIFAPAAAHLENGVAIERLGDAFGPLQPLALPQPIEIGDALEIHILRFDRFGNAITDLTRPEYDAWNAAGKVVNLHAGTRTIAGLRNTYSDVPPGEAVAYFGSGGRLEVAIHCGNAAVVLGLKRGATLTMRRV